ncbi:MULTISPECIES: hypothetical protein [Oscillatoriales]|uniref:hypothetical protein n=1 Tax=Oscillatoriophycideae TaxID=1301283 RepID=UPI0016827660|nr:MULTISPECIES: hypothetical protein [Oscillatoriales]
MQVTYPTFEIQFQRKVFGIAEFFSLETITQCGFANVGQSPQRSNIDATLM